MNAREMMELGEKTLIQAGVEDARNDSRLILEFMLGIDKSKLFTIWSIPQEERICNKYFELVDIRAQRIPLQHITRTQGFMHNIFEIDENVLIPRAETELLVEKIIDYTKSNTKNLEMLDLCCGSGAIGISVAAECKNINVTCSDIDDNAINLTKLNANKIKVKVKIKKSNMFEEFKNAFGKKKFDIISSNPPYIPTKDIDTLEPEVKEHEPKRALDGGEDGLEFYRTIAKEAFDYLKNEGMVFLEIGHNQGDIIQEIVRSTNLYEDIVIEKDLNDLDRMCIFKKKSK